MLTTLRIGMPVKPRALPERIVSAKAAIRWRVARTSGMTSRSPAGKGPADRRKATWSTARSSLALILSPANMRSVHSASRASRASAVSSGSVVESIRCFEKSKRIPSKLSERAFARPGSRANISLRCTGEDDSRCASIAFQAVEAVMFMVGQSSFMKGLTV